ncbi:MAG: hypothetical protein GXO15_00460, partial [Crenarchaeota archaeon]|nr:hypothetical protein [Thermoproteota archaeon]
MRVLWPGWCGLPFCPEPLPARLLAAEPRVLARLDPLAAEALEPGSSRAVAA